jgi:hypothetical protein
MMLSVPPSNSGHPAGPELEVAMVGGGSFGWEPREWTDDSSMAIAIAEVAASPEQPVNRRSRADRTREISAEVSLRGPSRC